MTGRIPESICDLYSIIKKSKNIVEDNFSYPYYHIQIYDINWNASGLSSGIYFARLLSKDYEQVQKLILIK